MSLQKKTKKENMKGYTSINLSNRHYFTTTLFNMKRVLSTILVAAMLLGSNTVAYASEFLPEDNLQYYIICQSPGTDMITLYNSYVPLRYKGIEDGYMRFVSDNGIFHASTYYIYEGNRWSGRILYGSTLGESATEVLAANYDIMGTDGTVFFEKKAYIQSEFPIRAPLYPADPSRTHIWNEYYRDTTNCYAYALNIWQYPFLEGLPFLSSFPQGGLQPGMLNSKYFPVSNTSIAEGREALINIIEEDINRLGKKLTPIDKDRALLAENTYKIALVIKPGEEYHLYRQNPDGTWSHKPGTTKVTDRIAIYKKDRTIDHYEGIITDPEEAAEAAGYFEGSDERYIYYFNIDWIAK